MGKMIMDVLDKAQHDDKPVVVTVELYKDEGERFPRMKISCDGAAVQRYVAHDSEDVAAYIQQYIEENM